MKPPHRSPSPAASRLLLCAAVALTCLPACNIAGFGDSKDEKSKRASDDDDDDRKKRKKKRKEEKSGRESGDKSKTEADKSGSASAPQKRTRLAELFGVESASTDLVPIVMDIPGVQLSRAKAWLSRRAAAAADPDLEGVSRSRPRRHHARGRAARNETRPLATHRRSVSATAHRCLRSTS